MRGHHVAIGYHGGLLADPVRVHAYDRALAALVRPGDVVLDVGAGTGILSMLAVRHGAARVHAVESGAVADVARALVEANGMADRITVHQADLVDLPPVEPVDLVVGDWLGRFVVDDEMLDAVAAARRWARPDARFCPERVDLHVGLLAQPIPTLTRWSIPLRGLDLTPALPTARNQPITLQVRPGSLCAPGARVHVLTPGDLTVPTMQADVLITQATAVFGLLGWFDAHLAPGVTLSTAPGHPTHWNQIAWPVPPTPLAPGDHVHVEIGVEPHPDLPPQWRWSLQVRRRGERILDHTASSAERPLGPPAPTVDVEGALTTGRSALQAGDLNAALGHLGAATRGMSRDDPRLPETHALLGTALAKAGLLTEAVDAMLAAVRDEPEPTAMAWLPTLYRMLGQPDEAERWRREHLRHLGPWTDPGSGPWTDPSAG